MLLPIYFLNTVINIPVGGVFAKFYATYNFLLGTIDLLKKNSRLFILQFQFSSLVVTSFVVVVVVVLAADAVLEAIVVVGLARKVNMQP